MPVIPVALHHNGGGKLPPMHALVDSGADCSLFPAAVAQVIGVDLRICNQVAGMTASGQSTRFEHPQPVLGDIMGRTLALSAQFQPGLPLILLGRRDFFAHFRVTFHERESRFVVVPY